MVEVYSEFDQAIHALSANPKVNEIFIIGGNSLYETALKQMGEHCKLVILTRIGKTFEADTFFPRLTTDDTDATSIFTKLHVSRTYSHKDITFDYCFIGNKKLLS